MSALLSRFIFIDVGRLPALLLVFPPLVNKLLALLRAVRCKAVNSLLLEAGSTAALHSPTFGCDICARLAERELRVCLRSRKCDFVHVKDRLSRTHCSLDSLLRPSTRA